MFKPRHNLFRSSATSAPTRWVIYGVLFGIFIGFGLSLWVFGLRQPFPQLFGPTHTPTVTPPPTLTPSPIPSPTYTPSPTPIPLVKIDAAAAAMDAGDWPEAIAAYTAVLTQNESAEVRASAQLGLAQAHWHNADPVAALTTLQQFLTYFPDSPHTAEAYFLLGEVYTGQADWGSAREAYATYLRLRPGALDSYAYERLAEAAQAEGDWAAAISAWQAAIAAPRAGGDLDLREALAATYAAQGDLEMALATYDEVFDLTDQNWRKARVDYAAGQLLYQAERMDEAYERYQYLVNNFPESPYAFQALLTLVNDGVAVNEVQRGLTNYYAENYEPALAAFERHQAAARASGSELTQPGVTLYYQALTLNALGRSTEAIATLRTLIYTYPTDERWSQAYLEIAFIQPYPDDVNTFLAFVAAVPAAPEAPDALYRAARLHERNGNLTQAAALWLRLANDYPTASQAPDAAMQAGVLAYRQADYATALANFEIAESLTTNPTQQARAWLWLGKAYRQMGQTISATAALEHAATLDYYGYYSLRAAEMLSGAVPFTPPASYSFVFDAGAEKAEAEAWLREHFPLAASLENVSELQLSVRQEPRFIRGAALWQLGLWPAAHVEFESLRLAMAGDGLASWQLALYYSELGAYDLAIRSARQVVDLAGYSQNSLDVPRYFLRLRYAAPFSAAVVTAGEKYQVHPFVMYAKMRIESFFWKYAYSSADARGLNQIIPPTADEIAQALALTDFTYEDLYRPAMSIPMGAYYLNFIAKATGAEPAAMLAGYYAGPGNAQIWLDLAEGDPDLFVEVIRLPDAKGYVQTCYEYFAVYAEVYGK